jgi:hypothetical protein
MIGIAFAELGFGTQIGIVITVALLFVLLVIIGSTFYELKRYREQFSQLEALIKNVENGKTNGDLNEILKSFR